MVINEGHVFVGGEEKSVHDFIQSGVQQLDRIKGLLQDEVGFFSGLIMMSILKNSTMQGRVVFSGTHTITCSAWSGYTCKMH